MTYDKEKLIKSIIGTIIFGAVAVATLYSMEYSSTGYHITVACLIALVCGMLYTIQE